MRGKRPSTGAKKPKRVVVLCKTTNWQLLQRGGRSAAVRKRLAAGDPSIAFIRSNHDEHQATRSELRRLLRAAGVEVSFRARLSDEPVLAEADLIIALGGDGTLLRASHWASEARPLLGINSAPGASVGYFCAAKRDSMASALAAALDGSLPSLTLARMAVHIDDTLITGRVLNDVLFANASPALATHYELAVGSTVEAHVSSGVWVGPPAGSTAAQLSAGGNVLPLEAPLLQYIVREPYLGHLSRHSLHSGTIAPGESLTLTCQMRRAVLYIDGLMRQVPIDVGSRVRCERSTDPLRLLGVSPRLHQLHADHDACDAANERHPAT